MNLVLIPGLISDQIVWAALADAARARFQIHHADITRQASIEEMAEQTLGSVDGPLIATGHSLGGRVAMEMARQSPQQVKGLVLANTGHHPRRDGEQAKRETMIALGHDDMAKLVDLWLPPMLDPARSADKALMAKLRAMVLRANAEIHERQIRALINRPDASAYLKDIRCPVLLIAARHDSWSPIAQHEEIKAAVPNGELAVIENAGHFAPVEQPARVTSAILDWLDAQGLSP